MAIEAIGDGGVCITGKDDMALYRLCVLKGRLKLELVGLKFRQSTYALVKREFGLKGSRQKVYEQFCAHVEKLQEERDAV